MGRRRFNAEEIVAILRESERGGPRAELLRKYNICDQTFYRWRKMYGSMGSSEMQRTKMLEKENQRLKRLVGEQALVIQTLKEEAEKGGSRSWG